MKKIISLLLIVLLLFSLTSCTTSKQIKSRINRLTYSVIDAEDKIYSYNYYPNEKREEQIIVEGYESIQNVKYVDDGFYCFAQKGKKTYILHKNKSAVNAIELPKAVEELLEIFEYKGKAFFITSDEDWFGSYLYIADFSTGKLNLLCKTNAVPENYFVVNDYIVIGENGAVVDISTSGSNYTHGKINIFDGKEWTSFFGVEPVFYDDTSFLYTKWATGSDTNGCYKYNVKEKTEEKMPFYYLPYDYDVNNTVFFNIKFLAPETVVQTKDERLLTARNINSPKTVKLKKHNNDIIIYFDVN